MADTSTREHWKRGLINMNSTEDNKQSKNNYLIHKADHEQAERNLWDCLKLKELQK